MRLVVNLSMVGSKPTGLGVYAIACSGIMRKFYSLAIDTGALSAEAQQVVCVPESVGIGNNKLAAVWRQVWLRRLGFDSQHIVYSPTHHGLPGQKGQIITLHDMICLKYPSQHYMQYIYFRFFIPRLLRSCRAVFTVSETTREDIIKTYGFPRSKIYIVPNSIDVSRFRPGDVDKQSPYLLMVGAKYGHKNVDEVLLNSDVWVGKYRLVVTSCSGKYRKKLEILIDKLGIRGSVDFRDYVDSEELMELYQGCSALVYPSKWEGFGIPPLEALACGRPVIASDIDIHREVLAGGAIYVELGKRSSWMAALSALDDEAFVSQKLAYGMERVRHFSPERALLALEQSLLQVEPRLERA